MSFLLIEFWFHFDISFKSLKSAQRATPKFGQNPNVKHIARYRITHNIRGTLKYTQHTSDHIDAKVCGVRGAAPRPETPNITQQPK